MKVAISELTYKIVALTELSNFDPDEAVEWATEMIELGYESRTLYKLASLTKPTNYFEVTEYVTQTLKELGLDQKSGEEAVLSFAAYYVHQIAKAEKVRENLNALYKFCIEKGYEKSLYTFYLLWWAWDDLDYEDSKLNHYWDGATRNNIEDIVVQEAAKWIQTNSTHYEQNR